MGLREGGWIREPGEKREREEERRGRGEGRAAVVIELYLAALCGCIRLVCEVSFLPRKPCLHPAGTERDDQGDW